MAGLYLHIPFCRSRCIYCGFYSTLALGQRQRYVDALCSEWRLRRSEMGQKADTVYLGGGTPSQLTHSQLRQLMTALPVSGAQEVTMECNPDDVTPEYAGLLVSLGVNRVSMGAQTFDDGRLRFLHRRHTAGQVTMAVEALRKAGIDNISIDLMYGFPGETLDDWQRDIDAALALDVEHVSAYCLMVEEGTMLHDRIRRGETEGKGEADEETERTMYETLMERMDKAGYEHYEISNFARPGRHSRHNSAYWVDIPYVGLGAAAHSYNGESRSWNVSDIGTYMDSIERGELPSERELLDADTRYNDRITVALRTSEGLDLATLSARQRDYCMQEARPFMADGLLRLTDGQHLVLTRKGLFVSDMVMSGLMLV